MHQMLTELLTKDGKTDALTVKDQSAMTQVGQDLAENVDPAIRNAAIAWPVKQFVAIMILLFGILVPLPVHASMLIPSGGWLMDDSTIIRTYTDFQKTYRLSAQHILRHDFEGTPITETITFVDVPFDSKSTALGYRHCKSNPESQNVVAVFSISKEIVQKSWLFDGKRFNEISAETVSCNKSLLMD
jgi:hypothetical protein